MSYKTKIEDLYKDDKSEEAITFLEDFCNNNPLDLASKFDLALLLVNTSVYADGHRIALAILEKLQIESAYNLKAILLKAHIEDMYIGDIENKTLEYINELIEKLDSSNQYYNLLFIMKAFYYRESNPEKYYKLLLDYIEKDPLSSFPYYLIGKYYKTLDKKEECKIAFQNAYKNIKSIFKNDEGINPIDFNKFIDYFYRGVIIAESQYKSMVTEFKN